MFKRLFAILALGAALMACSPAGGTAAPASDALPSDAGPSLEVSPSVEASPSAS